MDARMLGILKAAQAAPTGQNPNPMAPENSRWAQGAQAAAMSQAVPEEDPAVQQQREMELAQAEAEAGRIDDEAKQVGVQAKKMGAMTKLEQARQKYEEAKRRYEELKSRGAERGVLMDQAGESLNAGAPLAQLIAEASPSADGLA